MNEQSGEKYSSKKNSYKIFCEKSQGAGETFKNYRNKAKIIIKTIKTTYYENKIDQSKDSSKTLFQLAKEIDGVHTNQRVEFSPDKMNDYFVNIGKELAKNFAVPMSLETVKTVTESMVFQKTSDHEIFCVLKNLKNKTSADCKGYNNYLIKIIYPAVCSYLCPSCPSNTAV